MNDLSTMIADVDEMIAATQQQLDKLMFHKKALVALRSLIALQGNVLTGGELLDREVAELQTEIAQLKTDPYLHRPQSAPSVQLEMK